MLPAIRSRSHWNINNITPIDPVALGLCRQSELDTAVQAAARKKAAEGVVMSDDERRKLVSTEVSLALGTDAKMGDGLDAFTPEAIDPRDQSASDFKDAESFFNLPASDDEDEDDEDEDGGRKKLR
jgi:hypothetical protein